MKPVSSVQRQLASRMFQAGSVPIGSLQEWNELVVEQTFWAQFLVLFAAEEEGLPIDLTNRQVPLFVVSATVCPILDHYMLKLFDVDQGPLLVLFTPSQGLATRFLGALRRDNVVKFVSSNPVGKVSGKPFHFSTAPSCGERKE